MGPPDFLKPPKEETNTFSQQLRASIYALENPVSCRSYGIETLGADYSLYKQSLMLLPDFPAVEYAEYGMQVHSWSVDYSESEMVEGFNDSSHRRDMIQEEQDMIAFCDTLLTINQGVVEGSNDPSDLEDLILDLMASDVTSPTIKRSIQDHESVHHFELEERASPSYFPFSRSHEAEDRFKITAQIEEISVDLWSSETAGGHPRPSISGPDEGEGLKTFSEDTSQVRDVMGCARNITPDDIAVGERAQVEDCETSPETKFCFDEMLKFDTGSVPVAFATEFWAMVWEELQMIVLTIAGKAFYQKTEQAGSSIFLLLKSSLPKILHGLKEKGLEVSLKVVRKEACKWIYKFMSNSNQKVATHPKHIKEIPRNWLAEHGNSYPLEDQYSKIAEEMGLQKRQVVNLFENARKRTFKNISGLDSNLKSHFSPEITGILRKWQIENGGKQPDPKSRQELMDQTKCSKDQIVDWFNNHKPGRERSKKARTV